MADSSKAPPPEQLRKQLQELEAGIQGVLQEEISFRTANKQFDPSNDTTELLTSVCEKLWKEKLVSEEKNFEEHSSELAYMCRHFKTKIDFGLNEQIYREQLALVQLPEQRNKKSKSSFALCCGSEFPPTNQNWWSDSIGRLVPVFQVLRAGQIVQSPAPEIVPGDIVYLRAGQKAVADGRVLVFSKGAMVDVTHLTTQPNDIRICSTEKTSLVATESRNIILHNSHLIYGTLFYMVVRPPKKAFIPSNTDTAEFEVDTMAPPGLSSSLCQSVFKSLVVKAHLVCKGLRVLDQMCGVGAMVVLLTKELLQQGSVVQFCNTLAKLQRAVLLINCDCSREELQTLSGQVDSEIVDFDQSPKQEDLFLDVAKQQGEDSGPGSPGREADKTPPIDMGSPTILQNVTDQDQRQLEGFAKNLNSKRTYVINSISQAQLLFLLQRLRDNDRPVLYAVSGFHYAKCFLCLKHQTHQSRGLKGHSDSDHTSSPPYVAMDAPVGGAWIDSKGTESTSSTTAGQNTRTPTSGGDTKLTSVTPQPVETPSVASMGQSNLHSLPSTSKGDGGAYVKRPDVNPQHKLRPDVILSINSIGVVSEQADCILLKEDLAHLATAFEIICKKLAPARKKRR
jgi:hypothetical protein